MYPPQEGQTLTFSVSLCPMLTSEEGLQVPSDITKKLGSEPYSLSSTRHFVGDLESESCSTCNFLSLTPEAPRPGFLKQMGQRTFRQGKELCH